MCFEISILNIFLSADFTGLSMVQIANSISLLHSVVGRYPNLAGSRIFGPDIGGSAYGYQLAQTVANVTGSFLRALTAHHYYFGGNTVNYTEYLKQGYFETLRDFISKCT